MIREQFFFIVNQLVPGCRVFTSFVILSPVVVTVNVAGCKAGDVKCPIVKP